jgi:hypothetical protein
MSTRAEKIIQAHFANGIRQARRENTEKERENEAAANIAKLPPNHQALAMAAFVAGQRQENEDYQNRNAYYNKLLNIHFSKPSATATKRKRNLKK